MLCEVDDRIEAHPLTLTLSPADGGEGTRLEFKRAQRAAVTRSAFTIVELIIALGLLAVFCGMFVPVLAAITRERRHAAQEQAALQHAANVLEDLTRRPFAEFSATPMPTVDVPEHVEKMLPGVEQTVTATPSSDDPPAVHVAVSLRWQSVGGTWSRPVQLSAWVHDRKGGTP